MSDPAAGPIAIKICGINDPVAFDAVVEAGADWVGFNFFPPSPRFVTPAQAGSLSAGQAEGPLRVGLFVDPSDREIAATLQVLHLDALQLYAPPARAADIRRRYGVPVWRAVGVAARSDLPTASEPIDRLLIEPKPPPGATRPGGNAIAFDWSLTAQWTAPIPWLLAGGLTPDNVADAIRVSGARAVDVSSGVERARGVKDPELIRAFVARAKAAVASAHG